ncbi:YidB family protein [Thiofilum flexile]|uniref:YidB family protein n=1 Tax=Thiofilum flexile TaxID=125627 RepID=UPI000382745C|nr:YidB family protein [Thiofilum flexile]
MDMSNIVQLGAQLFQGQLDSDRDGQVEMTEIATALMGLMSGSNNQGQGGLLGSLASLAGGAQGSQGGGLLGGLTSLLGSNTQAAPAQADSGLMSMVQSWVGTGANQAPSADQITQLVGQNQLSTFAQQLGISPDQAVKGLQQALPQMVDQATPSGSLDLNSILNSVGGVSGAIGLASKILGR